MAIFCIKGKISTVFGKHGKWSILEVYILKNARASLIVKVLAGVPGSETSSAVLLPGMLEQLFGSRTRIKLLKIFMAQPHQLFYVRELTRIVGERINSVRREMANLEKWGVVMQGVPDEEVSAPQRAAKGKKKERVGKKKKSSSDKRKYFKVNPDFVLFEELKTLVLKSQLLVGHSLAEAVEKLGKVKLLLLTGFFVSDDEAPTDLVVVGTLNRRRFAKLLRLMEKSFGHGIRYTLLSFKEFKMRRAMTDKFLYGILEGKKTVLVDRINN